MSAREKILAIQFKYFGDSVFVLPALRVLRGQFPDAELHLLVQSEVAPVFENLPWLDRLWPMRRERGRARLAENWSFVRALRREKFSRVVDFGGNDRGAILSFLSGAKNRLGPVGPDDTWFRKWIYQRSVPPASLEKPEARRLVHILSGWNIVPEKIPQIEIPTNPQLDLLAQKQLPGKKIFVHAAAGQTKKEWPLAHWAQLHEMAVNAGFNVVFTHPKGAREEALLAGLKKIAPTAEVLPPTPGLAEFLSLLKRASVFVSGDTGPLHFAAALGVPTISLFGPSSAVRWAPDGPRHEVLMAPNCTCGEVFDCVAPQHCLANIPPEKVLAALQNILTARL